ncbi:RNA polymerase-associated protein RapA [Thiohalocapsa marina]|uniref:RNA polymerase-associated protein RapA n=1 Tax=Thiohalocapsa marina TaxID=424902 RepID=A0A5M8FUQ4_9GAMM|nr:RNA polymerase-associated protein RapA [Thiohalocapsa marina]
MRPGQRWFSETEAELGLGLVLEADVRVARLLFPATGEERAYARREAPLWRAVFAVGDQVRDLDGRESTVIGVDEQDALLTYLTLDAAGCEQALMESRLDPHLHLNRPQRKLLAGRLDADIWFGLRLRTWRHLGNWAASDVRGLVGARISPIPHQLYIAAEVAGRDAPRVLLADEVGLGKTIEAGLILHRMLLEGRVRRVLILVPEPLLHQWLVELLRRFNLGFALFDRERLAALADTADSNPFETEQRVLCSLDLLTDAPSAAAAALAADWDLLILDEAHHLHWAPEESGLDYDLVQALAARAVAVLLLTATPEQFGRAGHFGRLRLLDPQRFGDYAAFLAEEADYAPVAEIAAALLDDPAASLTAAQRARLDALLGDDGVDQPDLMPDAQPDQARDQAGDEIVSRLLDRHGTGRVLFRNIRAAIAGFPERHVHASALTAPTDETTAADAADPRRPWLVETLRRLHPARVLLIAARADTVLALRRWLQERAGIPAAVFHEGMEIVERDRAAAYFADAEDGARILLCSEIGSEGRNFQFVHHLVLYDLPLEPDLLEQRIGRLDRIGQTQTIELHVPYVQGTASEVLYRWYAEGLDAFAASCPAAPVVHERLVDRLRAALERPADIDALVLEAADLRRVLNAELAAGRDRLLELNSHRPDRSAALKAAVQAQDADPALADYLTRFWDAFGVEHEPASGAALVVRPGRHMLQERFPGLPPDGLTATFERAHALAHEDQAFLTWEHPMVRSATELLTGSDLGSAALVLTRHPAFKAGELLLQMLYVAECPAPAELQAGRFLPRLGLHLLLDEHGRDRSDGLAIDDIAGRCLTGNTRLAAALLQARTAAIEAMLAAGEARARREEQAIGRAARARMQTLLGAELQRLQALARVNPAVREDEIHHLAARRARLDDALGRVHLRLDAVRLVAFG